MKLRLFAVFLVIALGLIRAAEAPLPAPAAPATNHAPLPNGLYAAFATPRGAIIVRLFYRFTPMTCTSFVGLAEGTLAPRNGAPFFTGLKWYRVVPGFVIQSGNPGLEDTGDTPIPYKFPDEFDSRLKHNDAGVLSMANAGPDTNGCEFFLTLAPTNRLNYLHSVFGRVVQGLDVLQKIQPDDAFSIHILRVGEDARAFKADEATFKALVAAATPYKFAKEPGPMAHFDDADKLLPSDPPRAKNFNFKLGNFERVTGVKFAARLFAKAPSDAQKIDSLLRDLAQQLGLEKQGALAVYFADRDEWRLWLSPACTADFMGVESAVKDSLQASDVRSAAQAFFEAARAEGDAAYAKQQAAAPADKPLAPGQKLKLQTDAVLDGLIGKLEPKR